MGEYTNSTQLRFDRSKISCGILEAHHIPKAVKMAIYSIANTLYHKANPTPAGIIIFSDVVGRKVPSRGEQMADELTTLVLEKKVGHLESSLTVVNPRTGNKIRMWTFVPNHDEFRAWYNHVTLNQVDNEE